MDTAHFALHIKQELEATQAMLDGLCHDLAGMIAASESTNADDEHDPEGATIAFERAQVTALIADGRQRLVDLAAASARLAAGTYQQCRRCGGPISPARLQARPSAAECVGCSARGR